eukprot:13089131-Alexandrium_andersonii.AAC.1
MDAKGRMDAEIDARGKSMLAAHRSVSGAVFRPPEVPHGQKMQMAGAVCMTCLLYTSPSPRD